MMNNIDKVSQLCLIDFPEPNPKTAEYNQREAEEISLNLGTAVAWIIICIYFKSKALKLIVY